VKVRAPFIIFPREGKVRGLGFVKVRTFTKQCPEGKMSVAHVYLLEGKP
jgi:hypothetical protein